MQFDQAQKDSILAAISLLASAVTATDTVETLLAQISTLTTERDTAVAAQAALQTKLDAIAAKLGEVDVADAAEDARRAEIHAIING